MENGVESTKKVTGNEASTGYNNHYEQSNPFYPWNYQNVYYPYNQAYNSYGMSTNFYNSQFGQNSTSRQAFSNGMTMKNGKVDFPLLSALNIPLPSEAPQPPLPAGCDIPMPPPPLPPVEVPPPPPSTSPPSNPPPPLTPPKFPSPTHFQAFCNANIGPFPLKNENSGPFFYNPNPMSKKRKKQRQKKARAMLNSVKRMPAVPPHPQYRSVTPAARVQHDLKENAPVDSAVQKADYVAKSQNFVSEWPESLNKYVLRCYQKCIGPKENDEIEMKLQAKIIQATQEGTLWTKNWDNEPLLLLQRELLMMVNSRSNENKNLKSNGKKDWKNGNYKRKSCSSSSSDGVEEDFVPLKVSKNNKSWLNRNENWTESTPIYSRKGKKSPQKKTPQPRISIHAETLSDTPVDGEKLQKRAQRFKLGTPQTPAQASFSWNTTLFDDRRDYEALDDHIVGTSGDLEKRYLRLTSAPDACTIRPPSVLKESLAIVKEKWKSAHDYSYACEQLKCIRQDLTVQGIRDSLTIEVYETHARIALEKGDHMEFNQCQSQLKLLYGEVENSDKNKWEFTCYRVLYYIFTKDLNDLTKTIAELKQGDMENEFVAFALKMSLACSLNNYHRFFLLYKQAPRMASYILDMFVSRVRKQALAALFKAYRPNLPVNYVREKLAFESESKCVEFLVEGNVSFVDEGKTKVDCKASSAVFNANA